MKLTEIQGKPSSREESYLSVLKKKVDATFKNHALIITSEIKEINSFLRRTMKLDDDIRLMLKVDTVADRGTEAYDHIYWKVIDVVTNTFPPNNILGVKPHIVDAHNGAFIILKRASSDESST